MGFPFKEGGGGGGVVSCARGEGKGRGSDGVCVGGGGGCGDMIWLPLWGGGWFRGSCEDGEADGVVLAVVKETLV